MSRSLWATAGACALALATVPGVALAKGSDSSSQSRGGETPAAASRSSGRRHLHHSEYRAEIRRRRPATQAGHRSGYLLALGAGYQQAAGSSRVRSLQGRLARLGFAPGPIDGRYGPLTVGSVERFQATADLAVDGIAGPHTLAALNATRGAVVVPGAGYRQRHGAKRVRSLQRQLTRLGFAPGPIDGRYGPLTTSAVRRFQRHRHLPASGVVTVGTLVALRATRHHRPPATAPATPPRSRPAPTRPRIARRVKPGPALPVVPILLAMALLGLATLVHSYRTMRRQIRSASASPPPGEATPSPRTGPEPRRARDHVPAEPKRSPANRATHDPTHTKCTTQNPLSSPIQIMSSGGAALPTITRRNEAIARLASRSWRLPTSVSSIQPHRRPRPGVTRSGGAGGRLWGTPPVQRAFQFLVHRRGSGR
jgi:peptidoglycan hydrolase-like protein with peptidoglycan-binding domain